MQNWLVKKFIKDYENINDLNVRTAYGKLSGKVGIFCNALLFAGKFSWEPYPAVCPSQPTQ